ncbi:hypothetical protein FRC10_010628 [Ceratobasidium sp. 414]|nr:hypothetical protein FRC10_010628 [Ceratobasidium sp. 414]
MFGDEAVDLLLKQSGCKAVVYSGKASAWTRERQQRHGIEMVELPESEYARALARNEKAIPAESKYPEIDVALEWPTPRRPVILINWEFQAFHRFMLDHLVIATPVALVPTPELCCLSGHKLAQWIETMEIGGLVSAAFNNTLGMPELGRLLYANRPPYTHLRPFPDFPPPLAVPISDDMVVNHDSPQSKGPGQEVQLWHLVDSCPQLAHIALRGGVPLKLEPFPGPGPAHGQLAMNLGDVFREVCVHEGTEQEELVYAYVGRLDDYLRLSADDQDINASRYEMEIRSLVESGLSGSAWRLDAVQMFGSNLPKTALVVQLSGDTEPDEAAVQMIHRAAEMANDHLKLAHTGVQINPAKRLLVTTHGINEPGRITGRTDGASLTFSHLRLSYTHKRTLRRWQNVKIFGPWLEQLDWT